MLTTASIFYYAEVLYKSICLVAHSKV